MLRYVQEAPLAALTDKYKMLTGSGDHVQTAAGTNFYIFGLCFVLGGCFFLGVCFV